MELQGSLYKIVSEGEGEYVLSLNAEHFIYQAHFPGKPITPGVCIIKIATELIGKELKKKVKLKAVKNVKFTSVISPITNQIVTYKITKLKEEEETASAQIVVSDDSNTFAKISIIVE